ncbi:MAG TPA: putative DNA-binding domain-containing protein [Bacteriovoracaceae bacterium]|nr:putative DNA-binding domain-containing protein [Bacteriovoracaceae bacterium]
MREWFDQFTSSLKGAVASRDLIGAGTANAEIAVDHYRYQHRAKVKEAIEDTFPELLRLLGKDWKGYWDEFWKTNPASPRSLDFYPEGFLNHFLMTNAPAHLKQLARFEHFLDIHPWTHGPLDVINLNTMCEESCLTLAPLDVRHFTAPVVGLYQEIENLDLNEEQQVIIWVTPKGTKFRVMQEWELKVMSQLHLGVGIALQEAPEDADAVSTFFQWLGKSGLIRDL